MFHRWQGRYISGIRARRQVDDQKLWLVIPHRLLRKQDLWSCGRSKRTGISLSAHRSHVPICEKYNREGKIEEIRKMSSGSCLARAPAALFPTWDGVRFLITTWVAAEPGGRARTLADC